LLMARVISGAMRLKGGSGAAWSDSPAVLKLREMAKTPYDLTAKDAITPGRLESMKASACGLSLLYGTERVDEATVTPRRRCSQMHVL